MKYISIFTILAYLLGSYGVMAALPPTSTQGSAGGGYNTTFKFNFPYIPITQSGTIASFERIPLDTGVTNSLPVTNLNSGVSASSSTFWRGDGTWAVPPNSGDVVGPASSTDEAITRYDGTTGKLLQNSIVTIGDTGNIAGAANVSASGIVTASQANLGGAIGNGATIGVLNVKGTDSLGSGIQLEGAGTGTNRFLYITPRENGDMFFYNPGLNRVLFDYNAAVNAMTIGQSGGTYQSNVVAPDSDTTVGGAILQGTGFGLTNTDTTDGNYSIFAFQGSAAGRTPDSAIYGVHDDHNGASSTGSMEFWTRNAGTFSRKERIAPNGIHTWDAYSTGIAHFNASGVVTSSAVDLASGDVTGLLPNANIANPSTTVNGQTCTLGGSCTIATGSSPTSIGTIDSQAKSANGLVTSSTVLYAQTADVNFPGLVSTSVQTFAGAKTFRDTLTLGMVTASRPLKSDGSKGVTSSQIILSSSNDVIDTLGHGNGGTGISGTPTNGQLLIGNGSGYSLATITAGSNVTVTNSAGGITINSTATGSAGSGPQCQLVSDSNNGFGSTNTAVRRFINQRWSTGSCMTVSDSVSLGEIITINTSGVYAINWHDEATGGSGILGIVVNGTNPAGNVRTSTYAQGVRALNVGTSTGSSPGHVSWTGYLFAGDYVWFQSSVSGLDNTGLGAQAMFTITQITQ